MFDSSVENVAAAWAMLTGERRRTSAPPTGAPTSRTPFVRELRVTAAEGALVAEHSWDIVGARGRAWADLVDGLERRWPLPLPEPGRGLLSSRPRRCCSPPVSGRGCAAMSLYCFAYWA